MGTRYYLIYNAVCRQGISGTSKNRNLGIYHGALDEWSKQAVSLIEYVGDP